MELLRLLKIKVFADPAGLSAQREPSKVPISSSIEAWSDSRRRILSIARGDLATTDVTGKRNKSQNNWK